MGLPVNRFVSWFLPPEVASIDRRVMLDAPYDPENLGVVMNMSSREHRNLLDGIDRLDRKLLAVITAGGVYAAILVSVRETVSAILILLAGVLAVVGIGLAYIGWRTHPIPSVSSSDFVDALDQHPDDLRRLTIIGNIDANKEIDRFIVLKSRMFHASWLCFSLGALSTMVYTVLGGLL